MENLLKQMVVIFLTLTLSFFLASCDEDEGIVINDSDSDSDSDSDTDTDSDTDSDSDSDSDSDTDTDTGEFDQEGYARCMTLASKIDDVWEKSQSKEDGCDVSVIFTDGKCQTIVDDSDDYTYGCAINGSFFGDILPLQVDTGMQYFINFDEEKDSFFIRNDTNSPVYYTRQQ